jgi:multiple sugar transport system permease protein
LALLLSQKIPCKNFFKAGFFLPTIISLVVISLVFKSLYAPHGYLNFILDSFGIKTKVWQLFGLPQGSWLLSPKWSLLFIMIMDVWAAIGFYMVLFLAALANISKEYYDAAKVDGAGPIQRFISITLPLLKPMILFVIVVNTIFTFQVFTEIYTMTPGGGVFQSTITVVYYLYEKAFRYFDMGYASAMAYLLFSVIFIVSIIQMRLLKSEI